MPGRKCPNPQCRKNTFHVNGNHGECSSCGIKAIVPVGSGRGIYCPFCGKYTVFNDTCNNKKCNAVFKL